MTRARPDLRVAITTRAIAPWHGRGGLERHVSDLVLHLTRLGASVHLIAPPPARGNAVALAGVDPALLHVHAVPYVTFPGAGRRGTTILDRDTAYPLFGWRAGRLAAHLVSTRAVDVVHGLGASVLGYAAEKRRGCASAPLVLNPQGLEEFGAGDPRRAGLKRYAYWPLQRAVRASARAADAVIATDRSLVPVVEQHLRIARDRLALLPNAIDLERLDALSRAEDRDRVRDQHGIAAQAPVLLSVGRIERNKGFQVLADAIAPLRARVPDLRWVLIGEGPYRDALDQRIDTVGLRGSVVWARRVDDRELHAWFDAADLFVHPTLYEGSSLVTLEAMAHRKPVVATRAGGLPDKVVPGVTGWLVQPGDPNALRAALEEAIAQRVRWPDLGAAGRTLAEREFAWPPIARRTIELYRALVAADPVPAGLAV